MKLQTKKTLYMMLCLVLFSTRTLTAGINGNVKTGIVSDSNVYGDYRNYGDSGMKTGAELLFMGKANDTVYPRFSFEYSSLEFPTYNLENQNSSIFTGALKVLIGDMLTISGEIGSDIYNRPYQDQYSTALSYFTPSVTVSPYYYTDVSVGLVSNSVDYPNYDLDYSAAKTYLMLEQEVPLDATLKVISITGNRDYSERLLYDTSSSTYPVLSSEYRRDTESNYTVKLERYIEKIGDTVLAYSYEGLDSNDNEFYWGALQTPDDSTPGDEQVLSNYWDYGLTNLSFSLKSNISQNLLLNLYWHSEEKTYVGWMARDSSDSFLSPAQSRHDTQQTLSVGIEMSNRNVTVNLKYENTANQSNDYPYDYTGNVITAGIKLYF